MADLLYKLVPPEDVELFVRQEAQAFSGEPDIVRFDEQRRAAHLPHLRGLYADGQLVAQLQLYPLQVATGGPQPIAACGVGSVVVPPEQRRRGYTEALLRHTLDELREQQVPLCALYAYSRAFYHRFGWATAMERRVYRGAPGLLRGFARSNGGAFARVGTEAIRELDAVYRAALRGRFGPLLRDEQHWATQVLAGWEGPPNYAYLWRDQTGKARAYLIYHFDPDGSYTTRVLQVREAVALDPEARAQILALIADHDSQCLAFELRTPADAPVGLLMPDPPACEVEPYFLYRFVDLARALEAFPFPGGSTGRLTLALHDPWYAHTNGIFELEVASGAGRVRRLPASSPADLACDVQVLMQIYTRYLRPRTAAAFGLLYAHSRPALALLDDCFSGLAPFMSDYF
jgi:predicted acetyltransferase